MISREHLMKRLDYDPLSGIFRRRSISKYGSVRIGDEAGSVDEKGYIRIRVDGQRYRAHRLAWFYVYGYWPQYIDHINQNRSDNRITNLREASKSENARNQKLRNNNSGICGVWWDERHKSWRAHLAINGDQIYLGRHKKLSDAIRARKQAERKYGFSERHGLPIIDPPNEDQ